MIMQVALIKLNVLHIYTHTQIKQTLKCDDLGRGQASAAVKMGRKYDNVG